MALNSYSTDYDKVGIACPVIHHVGGSRVAGFTFPTMAFFVVYA